MSLSAYSLLTFWLLEGIICCDDFTLNEAVLAAGAIRYYLL